VSTEVIASKRAENEKAEELLLPGSTKPRNVARSWPRRACSMWRVAAAPDVFAQIARRFDLSIVGQPQPALVICTKVGARSAVAGSGVGRRRAINFRRAI
jgi:hypothetical protein